MLGNWATGRLSIVIVPTITMTIEITMATMGRLMKNFDIGLPSLTFRGKRLRVHLHARTHLLHAFGNHAFASLQSVRDNPIGADTVADLNRAENISGVGKKPGDPNRARALIHLAVRKIKCPVMWIGRAVS